MAPAPSTSIPRRWHRRPLALLLAVAAASAPRAQNDLRDRITVKGGDVVTGRVVYPFAPDRLLIQQGGKRVRVDVADVTARDLVMDRVRDFFARRDRHRDSKKALRYLVDEAEKKGLTGLARLQALELVLLDDTDEAMHTYLGHRQRGKKWQWPHRGRFYARDKLDRELLEHPMELRGERFTLTCDAGLLTNVRALFDLERLGVEFFARFGESLRLSEVLRPIAIRTFRNVDEFPKWGFRPRPYYEPPPHGDLGRTFFSGPSPARPEQLFFLGTQALLYRTMIGEVSRQNRRDRACAWVEIGLGMHMQHLMQGDAGYAKAAAPTGLDRVALTALGRGYRLTHLVHLPMYESFYLTDDTATATNWAAATMFVTWLLDDERQPNLRGTFLRYVREALADRKGDSSSHFDKVMGQPIEQFEEPWRAWLNQVAGN